MIDALVDRCYMAEAVCSILLSNAKFTPESASPLSKQYKAISNGDHVRDACVFASILTTFPSVCFAFCDFLLIHFRITHASPAL